MGRSRGDRRGSKVFVTDVRAVPARLCEESFEKAFRVRVVWVYDSRRRERGVGDQATRAVSAHKCTIAGEEPAHVARRGIRACQRRVKTDPLWG